MKKGGINFGVIIILGIIILAVSISIFTKISKWECFKDPFNCRNNDKTIVELASDCAIARCKYGCNSFEVKKIKGRDFECENTCNSLPWDDANNPKICDHGRPIIIQLEQPTDLRIKKTDFNCLLNTDKKWLEIQDSYFELLLRRCELGTCPTILIDTNLFDEFGNRDANECFVNTKTKQTMLYISYGYVNFFGVGSLGIVCDSFPFGYISDSPIYSPVDKDTIVVKPGSYFALDENNGILLPLGGMKYNFVAGNC
ncbi:MAG: hypothetical protein QXF88_00190 [Candidatus Aenigmatarchaeota archaeon]